MDMRDFGVMTGQELLPLLATLWQEGALAAESETQALVCVHEITGAKTTLYFCQDFLIRTESPQRQPDLIDIFYLTYVCGPTVVDKNNVSALWKTVGVSHHPRPPRFSGPTSPI